MQRHGFGGVVSHDLLAREGERAVVGSLESLHRHGSVHASLEEAEHEASALLFNDHAGKRLQAKALVQVIRQQFRALDGGLLNDEALSTTFFHAALLEELLFGGGVQEAFLQG